MSNKKLCIDCGYIYEGEKCPKCGSELYWWYCKYLEVKKHETKQS